jgi:hypothetical protein
MAKHPPSVARGTVVRLRTGQGVATNKRGIVMSNVTGDAASRAFSRAYGRQVHVCTLDPIRVGRVKKREAWIMEKGAGDLIPVGKVKKIPKACRDAMKEYKR